MNTENNKIIAEFMGLNNKIVHFEKFYSWSDAPFFYTTEDSKEKVVENIAKYSKYHSDWNWLMEVVEKIESLGFETSLDKNGFFVVFTNGSNTQNGLFIKSKIEAVCNVCVEFIKWYNEQKA